MCANMCKIVTEMKYWTEMHFRTFMQESFDMKPYNTAEIVQEM